MNIEVEMLISILKLSKEGPFIDELVNKDTKAPKSTAAGLLRKLQNDGLIYLRRNVVETNAVQRIKLAVKAIQAGADWERVARFLQWKEFEGMAAAAFEQNGYSVKRNLHFSYSGQKWEMDVVGVRGSLVACVDCKHWQRGLSPAALKRIAREQAERTFALSRSLPNPKVTIEGLSRGDLRFVPAVLSLNPGELRLCDDVPVVPVLQLQDFVSQLPFYVDSLKHFRRSLRPVDVNE